MVIDTTLKQRLKDDVVACLAEDEEIKRIVIFGSFNDSPTPADMDIAVFQTSKTPYIPLALKYRRQMRPISRQIPIDIIPLRADVSDSPFLAEINKGETIYER